jgi:hypothetical protein
MAGLRDSRAELDLVNAAPLRATHDGKKLTFIDTIPRRKNFVTPSALKFQE